VGGGHHAERAGQLRACGKHLVTVSGSSGLLPPTGMLGGWRG
jgi:hypothetical protein